MYQSYNRQAVLKKHLPNHYNALRNTKVGEGIFDSILSGLKSVASTALNFAKSNPDLVKNVVGSVANKAISAIDNKINKPSGSGLGGIPDQLIEGQPKISKKSKAQLDRLMQIAKGSGLMRY